MRRAMNRRDTVPSWLKPGDPNDELAAIVALVRAKLIPASTLPDLFELLGSAVSLLQSLDDGRFDQFETLRNAVIHGMTPEIIKDAREAVRQWVASDLHAVTSFDPAYPSNLRRIFNRPPLLFSSGHWDDQLDSHSIAVVGARQVSDLGLRRTRKLTRQLVEAGFTILSGLARGVDTMAHRTALDAGGRTVAVMGTGLGHRYPRENAALADEIVQRGALISQFFPHQRPAKWTFPLRNVVMSGLSLATVVVEASHSSGARIQARVALEHGRTVFLLQSLVESHQWASEYVTEGRYGVKAIKVTSTDDILSRVSPNTEVEPLSED